MARNPPWEVTLFVLREMQKLGDVQLLIRIIDRRKEGFNEAPEPQRSEFYAIEKVVRDMQQHERLNGIGAALSLDDPTVKQLIAEGFPRYKEIASRNLERTHMPFSSIDN